MPELWFYEDRGERRRPVHRGALEELARAGTIHPATRVWTKSLPDWTPAFSVSGLFDTLPPPPLPRRSRQTVPGIPKKPVAPTDARPLVLVGRKISEIA